ncbi:late competence development ComFB family protein [Clostridium tagluense]|uniref:Competence protein ComFB n=1 Tax=Clostridium tagluense TaxID=360422 RepID=A0A401UN97_9CLOT|nr:MULTISPECIES: late competence development ComFB family protein [Clostridium]MBW9155687.1 late competence development ComFB family protein [Clostridium tagluense]MBZ9625505.1 late competence development ComFB family protein [Clostridium sp. FP2]MCB2310509.1 late competence development ComFB family protein [Clostridium tagluense]MCB2315325.1 late competence development ComFB family protein [Clostridium tagluense]MCB2320176.1 late competence development ComFB family protein [Clostridium taglue
MYNLKNFSETEVSVLLEEILQKHDTICKCEKCKLDIKALSLNALSTKYIVSEQGEIYTKALNEVDKQEQINVVMAITKAIDVVSANPKH